MYLWTSSRLLKKSIKTRNGHLLCTKTIIKYRGKHNISLLWRANLADAQKAWEVILHLLFSEMFTEYQVSVMRCTWTHDLRWDTASVCMFTQSTEPFPKSGSRHFGRWGATAIQISRTCFSFHYLPFWRSESAK